MIYRSISLSGLLSNLANDPNRYIFSTSGTAVFIDRTIRFKVCRERPCCKVQVSDMSLLHKHRPQTRALDPTVHGVMVDRLVHGVMVDRLGLGGMIHGLILGRMVDGFGPSLLDEDLLPFQLRMFTHWKIV